jgi:hypothetical protein
LAAAWSRHDFKLANAFLANTEDFTVVEVVKAVEMLDRNRRLRANRNKLARLELQIANAGPKEKGRLGRKRASLREYIRNCVSQSLPELAGSLTSSIIRKVKAWTKSIPKEKLEYFATHMPTDTWKRLADLCHLSSKEDFTDIEWFLEYCFDPTKAPKDTLAHHCANLTRENLSELLTTVNIPFSRIKMLFLGEDVSAKLSSDEKARIAKYTPDLNSVIWNYEDLACKGTDDVIMARLADGETLSLSYGKLMERILMLRKRQHSHRIMSNLVSIGAIDSHTFSPDTALIEVLMPRAEGILAATSCLLDPPVVVIGDASRSMSVSIETAIIMASILSANTDAELCLFNDMLVERPSFSIPIPKSCEEILNLALDIPTEGCSCPAAGLWPYFSQKKIVKTFIIATDEKENTDFTVDDVSYRFLELFSAYHELVYPAHLIFLSFIMQHEPGQMVPQLREAGFNVKRFRFSKKRPDLSRLDNVIGHLALQTAQFDDQVNQLEEELREKEVTAALQQLNAA